MALELVLASLIKSVKQDTDMHKLWLKVKGQKNELVLSRTQNFL